MKELIDLNFYPVDFHGEHKHPHRIKTYAGGVSAVLKHTVFKNYKPHYLPDLTTQECVGYDRVNKCPIYVPTDPHYEYYQTDKKWNDPDQIAKIYDLKLFEDNFVIGPDQTNAKFYNKWVNNIAIGDFVKCKNQRDCRVWKKIVDISDTSITCMQYRQPIDDVQYFDGHSSTNLIYTIKEKFVAT